MYILSITCSLRLVSYYVYMTSTKSLLSYFFYSISASLWYHNIVLSFNRIKYLNNFHWYLLQVALSLAVVVAIALAVLMFCRLRYATPRQITAEIKRELRNKGTYSNCKVVKLEGPTVFNLSFLNLWNSAFLRLDC